MENTRQRVTINDLSKLIADLEQGHPLLSLEDQQLLGHLMRWRQSLEEERWEPWLT